MEREIDVKIERLYFKTMEEFKKYKFSDKDKWEKYGYPELWVLVESMLVNLPTSNKEIKYEVFVDFAYGTIMLCRNGRKYRISKNTIVCKDCVVLDKDYYGVKKYIWV